MSQILSLQSQATRLKAVQASWAAAFSVTNTEFRDGSRGLIRQGLKTLAHVCVQSLKTLLLLTVLQSESLPGANNLRFIPVTVCDANDMTSLFLID